MNCNIKEITQTTGQSKVKAKNIKEWRQEKYSKTKQNKTQMSNIYVERTRQKQYMKTSETLHQKPCKAPKDTNTNTLKEQRSRIFFKEKKKTLNVA